MPRERGKRDPAAPGDPAVHGEPRDYARQLGRRLTRRYVALGEDAVVLYCEPMLIRRDLSDADWAAYLAWREQPGHVVETMPPVSPRAQRDETPSRREPTILTG